MKPHIFAQMVNEIRDLALNFGNSEQFRDRVSDLMSKYIPIESSLESGVSSAVLADVALDVHAMQYKIEQKDEEIERLRKKIAELEARVVVVPEYETMADLAWKHYFDPLQGPTDMFAAGRTAMYKAMCAELRAIPADRVLGEEMVGVSQAYIDALENAANQFCGTCREKPTCSLGMMAIGKGCGAWKLDAKRINALRANQGGAAT